MEKTIQNILSACSLDGKPEHAPAQFRRRVEKAAELVRAGKVFDGYVMASDGKKLYRTWQTDIPKQWRCECADFMGRGGYDTQLVYGGYGRQCKHTLAQIIAYYEGVTPRYYDPRKSVDLCDWLQGMTEQDADRIDDPKYQAALLEGGEAVLKYYLDEIMLHHGKRVLERLAAVLRVENYDITGDDGRVTHDRVEKLRQMLRTASADAIFRAFEISEIDGEAYADFWPTLYAAVQGGQMATLKRELMNEIDMPF